MLNLPTRKKRIALSSFLYVFTAETHQCRSITYEVMEELLHHNLSKYFPALYHKLINDKAIFHTINVKHVIKTIQWLNRYLLH